MVPLIRTKYNSPDSTIVDRVFSNTFSGFFLGFSTGIILNTYRDYFRRSHKISLFTPTSESFEEKLLRPIIDINTIYISMLACSIVKVTSGIIIDILGPKPQDD